MSVKRIRDLLKYSFCTILWIIIAVIGALIISKYFHLSYKDTIFIGGIVLNIIGFFSSMEGASERKINLIGQGLGAAYNKYTNIQVTKKDQEEFGDNFKKNVVGHINDVTLIIAGLITMFVGYLI